MKGKFTVFFPAMLCGLVIMLVGLVSCFRKSDNNVPSGTTRCLANVEYCQSLIYAYERQHGSLPNSLTNIGVPLNKCICPVTGVLYIYKCVTNANHREVFVYDGKYHDGGFTVASNLMMPERMTESQFIMFTNFFRLNNP